MITFKLRSAEICFDFSFFAVLALFFFFNSVGASCAFMCCIVHEVGHLVVMLFLGVGIRRLKFYGGGIRLSADLDGCGFGIRIAVLSAGCVANIILAVILYLMGAYLAATIDVMVGFLNMMPFAHLDGAQILRCILYRYFEPGFASKLLVTVQLLAFTGAAAVMIMWRIVPDATALSFAVYLLLVTYCDNR